MVNDGDPGVMPNYHEQREFAGLQHKTDSLIWILE